MDNSKARNAGLQWARQMVRLLIEQREGGVVSFTVAWRRAGCLTSARSPDPRGGDGFYSFFRRACQREWNGEVCADYRALLELADLLHHGEHQELSRNALVA